MIWKTGEEFIKGKKGKKVIELTRGQVDKETRGLRNASMPHGTLFPCQLVPSSTNSNPVRREGNKGTS
uniref:hypothetical protein n=1 Tax=uncultured Bacteroides sp. TaxID=162156 RepID=UPI00280A86A0|nr:hypothetical protein [uncultured Bacteroides sp.]